MKISNIFMFSNKSIKNKIKTSYGNIKVLEYGFESQKIEPLFIDMHGGGFVFGSPKMDEPMCIYLRKEAGVKIVSIDYPKAPKNPYPVSINAVYEIIKHYLNNADIYRINPEKTGIGGHSAGGNLAAVICIMAKEKNEFKISYQILDYPPLDLSISAFDKPYMDGAIPPKIANMVDSCYIKNYIEIAKSPYVSPVYTPKETLKELPPVLLIVAGKDSLHDEGVRYKNLLTDAGVAVDFHDFTDSAHGFTYNNTPDAKKGRAIMAEFIKKHINTDEELK